jgi:hypothetical protein
MRGAQVDTTFVLAKPGTRGPKSWPMAMSLRLTPAKWVLAWRRWRQGESLQLPKTEVVNVACSGPMSQLLHYSYSTTCFMNNIIHALLGGGAPKWPPGAPKWPPLSGIQPCHTVPAKKNMR